MENENSERIIEYLNTKYCEPIGLVGLSKALCVASLKTNMFPLSIINVALSQHFKTRTSIEIIDMFNKNIENFGSDFTIHSLMKKYHNGQDMFCKVGSINDMTVLFQSKQDRTKNRLLGAFAESLTEGVYNYNDNMTSIEWSPKRWGIIGNITFEKFDQVNKDLVGSTLMERIICIFHKVNKDDFKKFNREKSKRYSMKFENKFSFKRQNKFRITEDDKDKIEKLVPVLIYNSLGSSIGKADDKIESMLCSLACLNGRNYLIDYDFDIVKKLINMTLNPMDDGEHKLLKLLRDFSPRDLIRKNIYESSSLPWLYQRRKMFKLRGLLDNE